MGTTRTLLEQLDDDGVNVEDVAVEQRTDDRQKPEIGLRRAHCPRVMSTKIARVSVRLFRSAMESSGYSSPDEPMQHRLGRS